MTIQVNIDWNNLDLTKIEKKLENMSPLYAAIAVELLKEIHKAFDGTASWARWPKLKASTLYGHRSGDSAKPLARSGRLRGSFRPDWDSKHARVGSPLKIAAYHHEGRSGPWTIAPRRRKALAFPWAGGAPAGGFKSYGHLKRSKTFREGKNFAVVRKVRHPGYPARPMLPPQARALEIANEVLSVMLSGDF
jgi:phage gpG-like protein